MNIKLAPSQYTFEQFDSAIKRSFDKDVEVVSAPLRNGRRAWRVISSDKRGNKHVYITTTTYCSCPGHAHSGHCYHRARVIFEANAMRSFVPAFSNGKLVNWRALEQVNV